MAQPPRALLEGSGVVVVPADPVEAALCSLAVGDLLRALDTPVRLVGTADSLRWIEDAPGDSIALPGTAGAAAFSGWMEATRRDRADWSLLLSPTPSPCEEAALAWLGNGIRLAKAGTCRTGSANVLLQSPGEDDLDASMRRLLRVLLPELPAHRPPTSSGSGSTLLEIPPDLPRKGRKVAIWERRLAELAGTGPLLVAHSQPLPDSIQTQVRALGTRVVLIRLESARTVRDLARRVGVWTGTRTPALALAALEGCRIHRIDPSDGNDGFPPQIDSHRS